MVTVATLLSQTPSVAWLVCGRLTLEGEHGLALGQEDRVIRPARQEVHLGVDLTTIRFKA
jgi:hypothetical protein